MTSVALVTLHGMGTIGLDYCQPLVERLVTQLGETTWKSKVVFQAIHYQEILQTNQDHLWERMNQEYPLRWQMVRQFMLDGCSDATTLEYTAREKDGVYSKVQNRIKSCLEAAFDRFTNPDYPLIVIAQSLGCQVFSNYVWDSQHNKGIFADLPQNQSKKSDFIRLKNLRYLFTTGCNIPLFVSGIDSPQCFKKPNDLFQWHNYFDPDDPLGWPLRPLGQSYCDCGIVEHPVEVGGVLVTRTPLSHLAYWESDVIIQAISQQLRTYF